MKRFILLILVFAFLLCSCSPGGENTETSTTLRINPEAPEIDYSLYPHESLAFIDFHGIDGTLALPKVKIDEAWDWGTSVRVKVVGFEPDEYSWIYEEDGAPPSMIYYVQVTDDFHGGTMFNYSEVHKAYIYGTHEHERYCAPPYRVGEEYLMFGIDDSRWKDKDSVFDFSFWFEIKEVGGVEYVYPYAVDISTLDYAVKITDEEENIIYHEGMHDAEIAYMKANNIPIPTFDYKCSLMDFITKYRGLTYGETYVPPETTTTEPEPIIPPDTVGTVIMSCKTPVCDGGFCDTPERIYQHRTIGGESKLCYYDKADGKFHRASFLPDEATSYQMKYSEYTDRIYFTKPGDAKIYSAFYDFTEVTTELEIEEADCGTDMIYLSSCLDKYMYYGYTGKDGIYHRYWYNISTKEKGEFSSGNDPAALDFPVLVYERYNIAGEMVKKIFYFDLAFYEYYDSNELDYSMNMHPWFTDGFYREYYTDYLVCGSRCAFIETKENGKVWALQCRDCTGPYGPKYTYYTIDFRYTGRTSVKLLFIDENYTYYSYTDDDSGRVKIARLGVKLNVYGYDIDVFTGEVGYEYKNMLKYGGDVFMDVYKDGEWQGYYRYKFAEDETLELVGLDIVAD